MKPIEQPTCRGGTIWAVAVLLLSLPYMVFVPLHALYAPGTLPEFLDLTVAWTLTVTEMVGAVTTLAAVVVAVIATLQSNVSRPAKAVMWAFVSLSLLACLYVSTVWP